MQHGLCHKLEDRLTTVGHSSNFMDNISCLGDGEKIVAFSSWVGELNLDRNQFTEENGAVIETMELERCVFKHRWCRIKFSGTAEADDE